MNRREVCEYFERTGQRPCKEAGLDIARTCPRADGSCYGRYAECSTEYVNVSRGFRELGLGNPEPLSFRDRFGLR